MNRVRHFGSYGVISATCAILNIAILIVGDAAGLNYLASTILSFLICVLAGYALHARFTFSSPLSLQRLLRYASAMSVNLPAALLAIWLMHDLLSLSMVAAAPVCAVVLTAVNYLLNRWAIIGKVSM